MKQQPEMPVVEGGVSGRVVIAPTEPVPDAARRDPPVLRLLAPPAEPRRLEPAPLRLVTLATSPAAAATPSAPTPPPRPEAPPSDTSRWTGALLRQAREARGLSLPQLAERTKVTRHHLENIEGDRFDRLPAVVYLRGILVSLAKELRLDGQKVARSYLEAMQQASRDAPVGS